MHCLSCERIRSEWKCSPLFILLHFVSSSSSYLILELIWYQSSKILGLLSFFPFKSSAIFLHSFIVGFKVPAHFPSSFTVLMGIFWVISVSIMVFWCLNFCLLSSLRVWDPNFTSSFQVWVPSYYLFSFFKNQSQVSESLLWKFSFLFFFHLSKQSQTVVWKYTLEKTSLCLS